MNTVGVLLAWGLAWFLVNEAVHSRPPLRVAVTLIFAAAFMVVAAAFLWHVKHGQP